MADRAREFDRTEFEPPNASMTTVRNTIHTSLQTIEEQTPNEQIPKQSKGMLQGTRIDTSDTFAQLGSQRRMLVAGLSQVPLANRSSVIGPTPVGHASRQGQ